MNTGEILRAAAARVRQGWCQGAYEDDLGHVCAIGAIGAVCQVPQVCHWVWTGAPMEAHDALQRVIGGILVRWNDAPWQTAEGVAQGLEEAAAVWDEQQAPAVVWTHRESHGSSSTVSAVAGLVE